MKHPLVIVAGFASAALVAAPKASPLAVRVNADFTADASAPFVHYAVPPMSERQRLPTAYPTDGVPGGEVRIIAAKGEYEPGSFLVWGRRDLGKVSFGLTEFRNEKGEAFPKADLDLKFVKVWYQNRNGWFSYFGDTGFKLLPELLVNDEDLVRVDTKKEANYARLVGRDGKVREHWINPPRQLDVRQLKEHWRTTERFHCLRDDFRDAATLQPVALPKEEFRNFFLTAHVRENAKPGLYRGAVTLTAGNGSKLGEIPVALRVLDFALPAPKCYGDPSKDFLVSSYSYISPAIILEQNGFDRSRVKEQLVDVFRNQVAHNQTMHMIRGNMDPEAFFCIEAMREAGMRMDVFQNGVAIRRGDVDGMRAHARRIADELDRRYGHHNIFLGYGDEPGAAWLEAARPVYEAYQSAGLRFFIAGSDSVFAKAGYLYDWHNIAKDPSDGSSTRLWNALQNGNRIAWYANHHVGTENPAFNRRQNGLAAYLKGYTSLCNYAHHFGEWNDDSTTYKPMVFAYGCGSGVIDTLQWEGFREGVDDIRYATLLTDLARKAQKSKELSLRYLGGKAMQYLAGLNPESFDQDACRGEMIRFITALKDKVPAYDVKSDFAPDPAAAKAGAARAEASVAKAVAEAKEKVKAATKPADVVAAQRAVAAAYKLHFRYEEAADYLESVGLLADAAALRVYEPGKAEALNRAVFAKGEGEANGRGGAFWTLAGDDPKLIATDFEKTLFSALRPTDTNGWKRAVSGLLSGTFGRFRQYGVNERPDALKAVWKKLLPLAKKWNVAIPAVTAKNVYEAYALTGDRAGAVGVAKEGLADEKAAPDDRYFLGLAVAMGGVKKADPKAVFEAARAFDAAEGRGVDSKLKVKGLCALGSVLQGAGLEAFVRGLNDFRKSLYKPAPKKRYLVKFSDAPVSGVADWKRVAAEETAYDRRYGGSLDFMDTDVSSGERTKASGKETVADPTMKIVADSRGLHFFIIAPDAKARSIEMGSVGGGSFEGYIAPGANEPYYCLLYSQTSDSLSIFNTQYSTFGHRRLEGDAPVRGYRVENLVLDDRIVTYLWFSWANWMGKTPKNGSVWDFENMFWHRGGNSCWNGTESIHGRSTWGELEFVLTDAQRASILRPLVARAMAAYKKEKSCRGYEGCVAHWQDTAVGDPAFYAASVKPFADSLDKMCSLVQGDMSDSTVFWLEKEALPKWADIRFEIDRLRMRWLEERNLGAK